MAENARVTCDQTEELLSGLIDEALEPAEHAAILRHLLGCQRCRATLTALRANAAALGELREVAVPAGFLKGVEARLPHSSRRSLARRLFTPWHVKVPIQAAALVLLAVGSVLLFRSSPEMKRAVLDAERLTAPAVPPSGEGRADPPAPAAPAAPRARDEIAPLARPEADRRVSNQRAAEAPAERPKARRAPSAEVPRAIEADAKPRALPPASPDESKAAEPAPKTALAEPRARADAPASSATPPSGVGALRGETPDAGARPAAPPDEGDRFRGAPAEQERRDAAEAPETTKDLRSAMEASEGQGQVGRPRSRPAPAREPAKREGLAKAAVASIRLRVPNRIEAAARLREGLPALGAEVAPDPGDPLRVTVPAGRYEAFLGFLRSVGEIQGTVPPAPASPDASLQIVLRLVPR
jgi:hypothetical protein